MIAGWTSVTLEFSAPGRGLRHLLVTLDETGRPISASDHVLFRAPNPAHPTGPADMRQESIGGRLEADGTFRGTCWLVTGREPARACVQATLQGGAQLEIAVIAAMPPR